MKSNVDLSNVDLIISGGAKGADKLAELLANEYQIPLKIFIPDWKTHGYQAGFIRNTYIVEESDKVIAFWDGKSKGTLDSINKAKRMFKPVMIIEYNTSITLEF